MKKSAILIKKVRITSGMTQREFALALDVSTSTTCLWEKGERRPGLSKIHKILKIAKKNKVKMSLEDFFTED
jgi:DNA-binding transcriptional regulator YiaG